MTKFTPSIVSKDPRFKKFYFAKKICVDINELPKVPIFLLAVSKDTQ